MTFGEMDISKDDSQGTGSPGDPTEIDGRRRSTEVMRPAVAQVVQRTMTGLCHSANKRAIDWSSSGLVAYASHGVIVVVDPISLQQVQCLDEHHSSVVQVRWNRAPTFKHVADRLTLASADTAGNILVWNVKSGEVKCRLADGARPVPELLWIDGRVGENNGHLLLALHLPSTLILWDTGSGQQVWKKTFSENIRGFDLDPFDDSRILLRCVDCILFLSDFSISKCPSGSGKKFYVSGPARGSPARSADSSDLLSVPSSTSMSNLSNVVAAGEERSKATRSKLKKMMKEFVMGEVSSDTSSSYSPTGNGGASAVDTLSECQQVLFHRAARSHLLLVYQREVLILDMDIGQTVGIITSNISPIVHVWSASQRDAIFMLYDNGVISMRCRKRLYTIANTPATSTMTVEPESSISQEPTMEICYEQKGQSETVRLNKNAKILGLTAHPITERNFAVLASDGRLIFVDVRAAVDALNDGSKLLPRESGGVPRPLYSLDDLLPSSFEQFDLPSLRLPTLAILSGLALPPFVIRMCPPLTMKNWNAYTPICAVGAVSGNVQIVNMSTGCVEREFALHTFPVRGIEWTGLSSILSHAHQNLSGNAASLVRNELIHTDIRTGKSTSLRSSTLEEPPIQMIRVSCLKQYFIVAFTGAPFELWDLKNLHPLRTMPRKFPPITALEWSPLHNLKSLKKKLKEEREKNVKSPTQDDPEPKEDTNTSLDEQHLTAKEHFVFTDPMGQLYHFSVEGNAIRDGTKLPAEASLSTITCISWKSDHIVRADKDGNINVWDVRTRTSRNINTNRGYIKKVRFASGRGAKKLLVLHNDSVAIWDAKECEMINELRTSKDLVSKPIDIEWAASDRPVVVTADGCLRIMSLALTSSSSAISEYEREEPVVCHSMLPNKARSNFQIMLHHQPWREKFSLEFSEEDGFSASELTQITQQVDALDSEVKHFLTHNSVSMAQRCLLAAQVSGLTWETEFWRLGVAVLERDSKFFDISLDLVGDRDLYVRYELERLRLQQSKCHAGQYAQQRKIIDLMLCLGLRDEAMRLLLETEPSNPNYYADHLLACLVSSTSTSEANSPFSTVKLVATNLIAEGKLWQGIQLLCLISKAKEACQYLQSYGQWDASLWLAKCHFSNEGDEDMLKVATKYCEHHFSVDRKKRAILVYLSLRDYVSVLDQLLRSKMIVLAAQFLEVLREAGVMPDTSHAFVLTEEISLSFARHMFDCGNRMAAFYYCDKADEKGEILQRELEMMTSSTSLPLTS